MRRNSILILFAAFLLSGLSGHALFAQNSKADSIKVLSKSTEIIQGNALKADSIHEVHFERVDTLQAIYKNKTGKVDSLRDRLENNNIVKKSNDRIDSIQHAFNQRSDSLQFAYKNKLSKLDSLQSSFRRKLTVSQR